ncbi:Chemotaxis protein methyltransferase [Desulfonema limicola]|uniref:Chemotaxis protein methyltransferase n=1 Tax=Desulfonema limicola TaxID=45656 RepID=A0A975B4G7_9BACT|nr:protein-glutamate O-methyltransferase CheR [Desulfonema limicola]QTA78632.1 Chemotaxis protein methyltransferase [Desulfonema limicola]
MEKFFKLILDELYKSRGIDLSGYRLELIEKRIGKHIKKLKTDPETCLNFLQKNPLECDRLIDSVLVNVSSFFRNPLVFEIIAQTLIPRIIEKKKHEKKREIRIWCAGCAAGEEAYSIAILIADALKNEDHSWWLPYIFATDISSESLKSAISGIYKRESLENTKLGIIDKYFITRENRYEVRPFIRKMVRFSRDDLTSDARFAPADSVFGSFDLILCRNVVIYFSMDLQKKVFKKLYTSLDKNSYLILGRADSPDSLTQSRLAAMDRTNRIFLKPEVPN